jgi:hypothetical protein
MAAAALPVRAGNPIVPLRSDDAPSGRSGSRSGKLSDRAAVELNRMMTGMFAEVLPRQRGGAVDEDGELLGPVSRSRSCPAGSATRRSASQRTATATPSPNSSSRPAPPSPTS